MTDRERREPRKKALLLYYDELEDIIDNLTVDELGEYLEVVFKYDVYGEPIESDNAIVELLAKQTARTLDRELKRYQDSCDYRKENRAKQEQQRYGINGISRGKFTFETDKGKSDFAMKYGDTFPKPEVDWQQILFEIYTNN